MYAVVISVEDELDGYASDVLAEFASRKDAEQFASFCRRYEPDCDGAYVRIFVDEVRR